MKKQINKIIPIFLLFTIFPMAKGLCFQDLLNSNFKVNIAQAEALDMNILDMDTDAGIVIDSGICDDVKDSSIENIQANIWNSDMGSMLITYEKMKSLQTSPFSTHHNSLLPCCLDENHPTAIVSTNSADLEKSAPQLFFTTEKMQFESFEPVYYMAPITAPPELYSIQKTILRL